MPRYKDALNVVPHNFANDVLKITSLSDSTLDVIVNGLDSFSAAPQSDIASWESVGDGLGQFAIDPDRSATFTFSMMAADESADTLWNIMNGGEVFSLSFSNADSPNLDCSGGVCLFQSRPTVDRSKEKPMLEWTVVCGYATIKSGSYTLVSQ